MIGWKECTLGDVVELKRGYDLPKRLRTQGPYPVVSSSGISGSHSEPKVKGPGVATGRYGTLGEVFYIENDFWPLNTALYVKDFKGNDPKFISYFLRTIDFASADDLTPELVVDYVRRAIAQLDYFKANWRELQDSP